MSLSLPPVPEPARKALADLIGTFLDEPPASVWASEALPIYVVDQTDSIDVDDLGKMRVPDAWRFILKDGGRYLAIGDVIRQSHKFTLSAVSDDPGSLQTFERDVHEIVKTASTTAGDYELRLFQAPAFDVHAMWLHRSVEVEHYADRFLLIDRVGMASSTELLTPDEFVSFFNEAQTEILETLDKEPPERTLEM